MGVVGVLFLFAHLYLFHLSRGRKQVGSSNSGVGPGDVAVWRGDRQGKDTRNLRMVVAISIVKYRLSDYCLLDRFARSEVGFALTAFGVPRRRAVFFSLCVALLCKSVGGCGATHACSTSYFARSHMALQGAI